MNQGRCVRLSIVHTDAGVRYFVERAHQGHRETENSELLDHILDVVGTYARMPTPVWSSESGDG